MIRQFFKWLASLFVQKNEQSQPITEMKPVEQIQPQIVEPKNKINKEGLEILKTFEGLKLEAYKDSGGIWTIGIGTIRYPNGNPIKEKDKITKEQAEEYCLSDIAKFEIGVTNLVKVPITSNQFSALVVFSYNVGLAALERSTLLTLLNSGIDIRIVALEFAKWNKVNKKEVDGLTKRRAAEAVLFLKV